MRRIRPVMIHALSVVVLLLLVAALSVKADAQTQSAGSQTAAQATSTGERVEVTVVNVKPEMINDFWNFVKNDTNPALVKGGAKWSDVWATAIGNGFEFYIVSPVENFAEFDGPGPLEKGLGKEGMAAWRTKAYRLVNSVRSFVLVSDPGLSYETKMTGPPHLAVLTFVTVAPGRNSEYESYLRNDYLPVVKQSKIAGFWVQETLFGGDPNEYVTLTLQDNFAELEKGPPARRVLGQEGMMKLMQKLPAGVITRINRTVIRFVPELSYRPNAPTASK